MEKRFRVIITAIVTEKRVIVYVVITAIVAERKVRVKARRNKGNGDYVDRLEGKERKKRKKEYKIIKVNISIIRV